MFFWFTYREHDMSHFTLFSSSCVSFPLCFPGGGLAFPRVAVMLMLMWLPRWCPSPQRLGKMRLFLWPYFPSLCNKLVNLHFPMVFLGFSYGTNIYHSEIAAVKPHPTCPSFARAQQKCTTSGSTKSPSVALARRAKACTISAVETAGSSLPRAGVGWGWWGLMWEEVAGQLMPSNFDVK